MYNNSLPGCVTPSWGLNRKRGLASRSDQTKLCCYYYFSLFHYDSHYIENQYWVYIILIIAKHKNAMIWVGFHSRNQSNSHLHHKGFVTFRISSNEHEDRLQCHSIVEHQRAFSYGRAGHHRDTVRIGITDVFKPSGAHGRTKLIAQVINWLGNNRSRILPTVIRNIKVDSGLDTNLKIMNKISIISIINITCIMQIMRIISIIFSVWFTCLNPMFQKISSIKRTMRREAGVLLCAERLAH